jgi:O-methyltransferase involved in polyketide biosynthesis
VDAFSRNDLGSEQGRFLFMMRSVLHYFGQKRLCAVLGHIRSQARPGEYFVHQTASFSRQEDAACLNEIYRMMGTKKWYPTCDFLCQCLKNEGWQVLEILPGFSLPLTGCELKKRYKLDQRDILRIKKRCSQNFQVPSEVFESTEENFCAYLHYWIYVCISRNISKNSTS